MNIMQSANVIFEGNESYIQGKTRSLSNEVEVIDNVKNNIEYKYPLSVLLVGFIVGIVAVLTGLVGLLIKTTELLSRLDSVSNQELLNYLWLTFGGLGGIFFGIAFLRLSFQEYKRLYYGMSSYNIIKMLTKGSITIGTVIRIRSDNITEIYYTFEQNRSTIKSVFRTKLDLSNKDITLGSKIYVIYNDKFNTIL